MAPSPALSATIVAPARSVVLIVIALFRFIAVGLDPRPRGGDFFVRRMHCAHLARQRIIDISYIRDDTVEDARRPDPRCRGPGRKLIDDDLLQKSRYRPAFEKAP